jgi:protein-L-isoaspartate(D-aspartate) O-methyltransferase
MKRWVWASSLLLLVLISGCGGEPTPVVIVEPTVFPSPTSIPADTATASPAVLSKPISTEAATEAPTATALVEQDRQAEREVMVESGVIAWGVQDEDVHEAMLAVSRHEFVPEEYASMAYENHPLPIGFGQTISQPFIVGLMTEAIDPSADYRVLEIGTGSGYQAAVLAELVDQVYSVEIIGPLHERAEDTLKRLGYENVSFLHADGYFGWEEHAPFDAIVVTAAPDHVPQPLVQQLKIGGKMIIPVGPVGGFQNLWLITRVSEDEVQTRDLGGVRFVPFTREER